MAYSRKVVEKFENTLNNPQAFKVGKFDPKSRLWVRNTMFQGAPIVSDISNEYKDEWFFPVMPNIESSKGNEIH